MKRKILSLALSGAFAVSALFGLVACKPRENNGTGGGTGGTGGTGNGTIAPGTVITDETIKNSVLSSLADASPEGYTFTGSLELAATQSEKTDTQKIQLEGAARFGKTVQADAYLSIDGDGLLYVLGFLRDDAFYAASGEVEGKTVDFTALKAQLKAKEDPIVLEKAETGPLQTILSAPAAIKLARNIATFAEGTLTKTEGGYSLSVDLVKGADALFSGAEQLADAIDKTPAMTLTSLFSQKLIDDTLTKLLGGVTAKELSALAQFLPEEVSGILPEFGNGSAKDYLLGLLRSGSFYTALAGEGEPWQNYQTFGEVPLSELVGAISGGEADLSTLGLKKIVQDFRSGWKDKLAALVCDLLSIEGEVSGGEVGLLLEFSFDNEKKPIGFSADAFVAGKIAAQTEELPAAEGTAQNSMRATLKLSATCASSPELFDLAGCKYTDGEETHPIG